MQMDPMLLTEERLAAASLQSPRAPNNDRLPWPWSSDRVTSRCHSGWSGNKRCIARVCEAIGSVSAKNRHSIYYNGL